MKSKDRIRDILTYELVSIGDGAPKEAPKYANQEDGADRVGAS